MKKILWLLLCLSTLHVTAQTGAIKGRTVTATGEPLAGVVVLLLGTTQGTQTDTNGFFEIDKVAEGHYILQCKLLGRLNYESRVSIKKK